MRLRGQEEEGAAEIARANDSGRVYENRIVEVGAKLKEVQSFLGDLNQEGGLIREQLRNYEVQNGALS